VSLRLAATAAGTRKRKSINIGRSVVTFLMGSQRLYDFVDLLAEENSCVLT